MSQPLTRTTLRTQNFTCPSCVSKIEKTLGRMPGVDTVEVRFASSRVEVVHDAQATPVEALVAQLDRLGYPAAASAF